MSKAIRKQLDAMRAKHGAGTAIGHRCSNLIEQSMNLESYERPEWATHGFQTLPGLIKRQVERIATLRKVPTVPNGHRGAEE